MAIRTITLGLLVAFLSSISGVIYGYSYYQLFDFSAYLPLWKIAAFLTFISSLLIAFSLFISTIFKKRAHLITSVFVAVISLFSIILPNLFPPKFTQEIEVPEMFPAFVMPLHFLVPIFWLVFSPYYLMIKQ
jgi:hypothetical protein